jgi:hypothetical protein
MSMEGLGSWIIGDIQIHGQLPPPLVWYGPPPVLLPSAFSEDWTAHHLHSNHLPMGMDVLLHHLHSALLQNILRPWILPHITRTMLGLVHLDLLISCLDVKSFELCKGGPRDDPCLAAIKEDGLDNSLVELHGNNQSHILAPKDLTYVSPSSMGFSKLCPNCLNIVIVLHHHLTKVFKDFDMLEYIPVNHELLAESQS